MKRVLSLAALVLLYASSAFATWSITAVDRRTGTVVIASATCVAQAGIEGFPAKDLRDIQAIVVPGKGVAAAQASVDRTRANQRLIFGELQKGTAPETIIALLREDPDIARLQFGIVDLQGRAAGFSGEKNGAVSLDRHGEVTDTGIAYSIQGNILASEEVVTDAVRAFTYAAGDLTDRAMAAMEAADAKGGDRRCSCEREPKLEAPCTAKTAHVAYLLRADKTDSSGESYSDGQYALYLSVTDRDITKDEDANPVRTLRVRYDRWRKTSRR